jgi:hypothetical protein
MLRKNPLKTSARQSFLTIIPKNLPHNALYCVVHQPLAGHVSSIRHQGVNIAADPSVKQIRNNRAAHSLG